MSGPNNVQWFGGETRLDLDPSDMLRVLGAEEDIDVAVVVARRKDGSITYHSSIRDKPKVAFLLNAFLHNIFSGKV